MKRFLCVIVVWHKGSVQSMASRDHLHCQLECHNIIRSGKSLIIVEIHLMLGR